MNKGTLPLPFFITFTDANVTLISSVSQVTNTDHNIRSSRDLWALDLWVVPVCQGSNTATHFVNST